MQKAFILWQLAVYAGVPCQWIRQSLKMKVTINANWPFNKYDIFWQNLFSCWLISVRLQWPQCVSNGVSTVLHKAINMHFHECKHLFYGSDFTEVCSFGIDCQYISVGLGDGRSLSMQQLSFSTATDDEHLLQAVWSSFLRTIIKYHTVHGPSQLRNAITL